MKQYKGYLIDLDGTMYRGHQPIDGASTFIEWLSQRKIPYLFVTNNSSVTKESVADKLQDMNIRASADRVITSSDAAVHYIKRIESNPKVYMIGEEGLRVALNVNDVPITNQKDANIVLIGLDRHITYEKLATAAL